MRYPTKNKLIFYLVSIITCCLLSQSALADAIIPSIVMIMPFMILLVIPVIFIEAYFFQKITHSAWKVSFKVTTVTNLFSTILGIPIAWAASLLSIFPFTNREDPSAIFQCLKIAWVPDGGGNDILNKFNQTHKFTCNLLTDLGFLWMFIFFFFLSWLCEYLISKWMMNKSSIKKNIINRAVFIGNIGSYFLVFTLLSVFFLLFFKRDYLCY